MPAKRFPPDRFLFFLLTFSILSFFICANRRLTRRRRPPKGPATVAVAGVAVGSSALRGSASAAGRRSLENRTCFVPKLGKTR